jgi:hypothetical protein
VGILKNIHGIENVVKMGDELYLSVHLKNRLNSFSDTESPSFTYSKFLLRIKDLEVSTVKADLGNMGTTPSSLVVYGQNQLYLYDKGMVDGSTFKRSTTDTLTEIEAEGKKFSKYTASHFEIPGYSKEIEHMAAGPDGLYFFAKDDQGEMSLVRFDPNAYEDEMKAKEKEEPEEEFTKVADLTFHRQGALSGTHQGMYYFVGDFKGKKYFVQVDQQGQEQKIEIPNNHVYLDMAFHNDVIYLLAETPAHRYLLLSLDIRSHKFIPHSFPEDLNARAIINLNDHLFIAAVDLSGKKMGFYSYGFSGVTNTGLSISPKEDVPLHSLAPHFAKYKGAVYFTTPGNPDFGISPTYYKFDGRSIEELNIVVTANTSPARFESDGENLWLIQTGRRPAVFRIDIDDPKQKARGKGLPKEITHIVDTVAHDGQLVIQTIDNHLLYAVDTKGNLTTIHPPKAPMDGYQLTRADDGVLMKSAPKDNKIGLYKYRRQTQVPDKESKTGPRYHSRKIADLDHTSLTFQIGKYIEGNYYFIARQTIKGNNGKDIHQDFFYRVTPEGDVDFIDLPEGHFHWDFNLIHPRAFSEPMGFAIYGEVGPNPTQFFVSIDFQKTQPMNPEMTPEIIHRKMETSLMLTKDADLKQFVYILSHETEPEWQPEFPIGRTVPYLTEHGREIFITSNDYRELYVFDGREVKEIKFQGLDHELSDFKQFVSDGEHLWLIEWKNDKYKVHLLDLQNNSVTWTQEFFEDPNLTAFDAIAAFDGRIIFIHESSRKMVEVELDSTTHQINSATSRIAQIATRGEEGIFFIEKDTVSGESQVMLYERIDETPAEEPKIEDEGEEAEVEEPIGEFELLNNINSGTIVDSTFGDDGKYYYILKVGDEHFLMSESPGAESTSAFLGPEIKQGKDLIFLENVLYFITNGPLYDHVVFINPNQPGLPKRLGTPDFYPQRIFRYKGKLILFGESRSASNVMFAFDPLGGPRQKISTLSEEFGLDGAYFLADVLPVGDALILHFKTKFKELNENRVFQLDDNGLTEITQKSKHFRHAIKIKSDGKTLWVYHPNFLNPDGTMIDPTLTQIDSATFEELNQYFDTLPLVGTNEFTDILSYQGSHYLLREHSEGQFELFKIDSSGQFMEVPNPDMLMWQKGFEVGHDGIYFIATHNRNGRRLVRFKGEGPTIGQYEELMDHPAIDSFFGAVMEDGKYHTIYRDNIGHRHDTYRPTKSKSFASNPIEGPLVREAGVAYLHGHAYVAMISDKGMYFIQRQPGETDQGKRNYFLQPLDKPQVIFAFNDVLYVITKDVQTGFPKLTSIDVDQNKVETIAIELTPSTDPQRIVNDKLSDFRYVLHKDAVIITAKDQEGKTQTFDLTYKGLTPRETPLSQSFGNWTLVSDGEDIWACDQSTLLKFYGALEYTGRNQFQMDFDLPEAVTKGSEVSIYFYNGSIFLRNRTNRGDGLYKLIPDGSWIQSNDERLGIRFDGIQTDETGMYFVSWNKARTSKIYRYVEPKKTTTKKKGGEPKKKSPPLGTLALEHLESPLDAFKKAHHDYFIAHASAFENLSRRLFNEPDLGTEIDDTVLKILVLLDEKLMPHLHTDLIEVLRPFVQQRSLRKLEQVFNILGLMAPFLEDKEDLRPYVRRLITLFTTFEKKEERLSEFLDVVDAHGSDLGKKSPLEDDDLDDTSALLYFRYLRGEVEEFLEEKEVEPLRSTGDIQNPHTDTLKNEVPLTLINEAWIQGKRTDEETQNGMAPSSLEEVPTIRTFEDATRAVQDNNLTEREKEMVSTISGQDQADNVFAREGVQNARDAQRVHQNEFEDGLPPIEIESFIRKGKNEWVRRVSDKAGMTLEEIVGPLLVVGANRKIGQELAGKFAQGFYTIFVDFDEVRIKTGRDGATYLLTIVPGANGLPILKSMIKTDETFKGTIIEWTKNYEERDGPPYFDALLFAQDLIRYVGAIQDNDIIYNGRKINEEYDAIALGWGEEMDGPVRVNLSQSSFHKRGTQDGLHIMSLESWLFELLPEKLELFLLRRGVSVDLPLDVPVSRARQGLAQKARYQKSIQQAVFVASIRLAVKLYLKRGLLPPGMSEDFFALKESNRIHLKPANAVHPTVLADAKRINSGNPQEIAQIDFSFYQGNNYRELAELMTLVNVNYEGDTFNLWDWRMDQWKRILKAQREEMKTLETDDRYLELQKHVHTHMSEDIVSAAALSSYKMETEILPPMAISQAVIDRSPSIQLIKQFFEAIILAVDRDRERKGSVEFYYKEEGRLSDFNLTSRTLIFNLFHVLKVAPELQRLIEENNPQNINSFFRKWADGIQHELAHIDEGFQFQSHQALDIEKDDKERRPYWMGAAHEKNLVGLFSDLLLQNRIRHLRSLEAGSWAVISEKVKTTLGQAPSDYDDLSSGLSLAYQEIVDQKTGSKEFTLDDYGPGSWAGFWMGLENGLRWMFRMDLKKGLTYNEAKFRFAIYGALEGLLGLALYFGVGDFGISAVIWTALNIVFHYMFGVFAVQENGVIQSSRGLALIPNLIAITTGISGMYLITIGLIGWGVFVAIGVHAILNHWAAQKMGKAHANLIIDQVSTPLDLPPVADLGLRYGDGRVGELGNLTPAQRDRLLNRLESQLKDNPISVSLESTQDKLRSLFVAGPTQPLEDQLGNKDLGVPVGPHSHDLVMALIEKSRQVNMRNKIYIMVDAQNEALVRSWLSPDDNNVHIVLNHTPQTLLSQEGNRTTLHLKALDLMVTAMDSTTQHSLLIALKEDFLIDETGISDADRTLLDQISFIFINEILNTVPVTSTGLKNIGRISRLISQNA